jgi:SAM-dependent methyltransferase
LTSRAATIEGSSRLLYVLSVGLGEEAHHVCTAGCLDFIKDQLSSSDVRGKQVLEVGSLDVNGSVRSIVCRLAPFEYTGVDIVKGPGVDEICSAEELVERFGPCAYDVVLSTEMLEHVQDWRSVVSNLKRILRPDGILVVTTRSRGFPFHGYPYDFWRFEVDDIRAIFDDLAIESLHSDVPEEPGVFLRARRRQDFVEKDLSKYKLYSIVRRRLTLTATPFDAIGSRTVTITKAAVRRTLPPSAQQIVRQVVQRTQKHRG